MKYKNKHENIKNKEYVPHVNIKISRKEKISNNKFCTWEEKICRIITVISHYHYFMDLNLGECKCALRRITCVFVECVY